MQLLLIMYQASCTRMHCQVIPKIEKTAHLLEYPNFHQQCQEPHHILVLVLSHCVVQLQVQHIWQNFTLADRVHEHIQNQVCVMRPPKEINENRPPISMVDDSCDVSSMWHKILNNVSNYHYMYRIISRVRICTSTSRDLILFFSHALGVEGFS